MKKVDHLVYATPNLEIGMAELEELLGVHATPGGQHIGYGTRNALIGLGAETYLEIIGPDLHQPDPGTPRFFGIDEITQAKLVAWSVKESNLVDRIIAAERNGVKLGNIEAGKRHTPDGRVLSWQTTDPFISLFDGIVPFLIDWGTTPHPARTCAKGCSLINLRAEHPDPERVQAALALIGIDLQVERAPAAALIAIINTANGDLELR